MSKIPKTAQFYRFCVYGLLKNFKFYQPFFLLYFIDAKLSYLAIGTLYAIKEILQNIFEIPSGFIADLLGRKRTIITSFIFYIISFLILFKAINYLMFAVGMVFYALGEAFRTGTHKAMIFDYLKRLKLEEFKIAYYGHTRSWSQIGSALSAIIAAFLVIYTQNYRLIFLLSIIPLLMDTVNISLYPDWLNGSTVKWDGGRLKNQIRSLFLDSVKAFSQKDLLKTLFNSSFYSGYFRAVKDYLQPLLVTLGVTIPLFKNQSDFNRSTLIIGLAYSLLYLLTAWSSRQSHSFSLRFSGLARALNITLFFGFMVGVGAGLFYSVNLIIPAVICFIAIYMIENLRKPLGMSIIPEKAPHNLLATAISAETQLQTVFAALLAPLIGFLSDRMGLERGLLIAGIIVWILSPLFFLKTQDPS